MAEHPKDFDRMEEALLGLLPVHHGHFLLASGHHGSLWLDLDLLFVRPRVLLPFFQDLARRLSVHRIDAIVGPLVGGAFVAQAVAVELGVAFAFADRLTEGGGVGYRVPNAFGSALAGKRVAIVDDAINAGSATRATHAALVGLGAQPVAVGALLMLGTTALAFLEANNLAVERIAVLANEIWQPARCPLCAAGEPLNNPAAVP
jgi:orotate phosphoribosyltransferase